MPMSTCGCSVRVSLSPSNQALSAGTAFAARDDRAHQAAGDVVAGRPGVDVGIVAERGRHDLRVRVGHHPRHVAAHALELFGLAGGRTRSAAACASACRIATAACARAVCRSGPWPRAFASCAGTGRIAGRPAPTGRRAEPSAAARLTSSIVTTPSVPLPRTRERSTPSLRASARTAGIALTPPTATRLLAAHRVGGLHRADHGAAVLARMVLRFRWAGIAGMAIAALVGGDDLVVRRGSRCRRRVLVRAPSARGGSAAHDGVRCPGPRRAAAGWGRSRTPPARCR